MIYALVDLVRFFLPKLLNSQFPFILLLDIIFHFAYVLYFGGVGGLLILNFPTMRGNKCQKILPVPEVGLPVPEDPRGRTVSMSNVSTPTQCRIVVKRLYKVY